MRRSGFEELKGGDATHNAEALYHVLDGKPSAFSDAAIMTAGAALVVAGKAVDIKAGVLMSRDAVGSGAAKKALAGLIEVSNS